MIFLTLETKEPFDLPYMKVHFINYTYAHILTYIHTYVHTYINKYIQIYIQIYINTQ